MNVNFGSGSQEQQDLFMAVFGYLMNYPILDHIEADLDVNFVEDPAPNLHNEFAYTSGTSVEIKQDAPEFLSIDPTGLMWGPPFFNEVVAHELAHAILSLLPSERVDAIAAMFGTTVDDWAPLDQPWEDRPLEGICETFKDAFLPRRYRSYSNRTNHHISISKYPEFRRHWRDGVAEMSGAGEIVPAADFDAMSQKSWREDESNGGLGDHIEPTMLDSTDEDNGLLDTYFTWYPEAGGISNPMTQTFYAAFPGDGYYFDHDDTIEVFQPNLSGRSRMVAWIPDGAILTFSFDIPEEAFRDPVAILGLSQHSALFPVYVDRIEPSSQGDFSSVPMAVFPSFIEWRTGFYAAGNPFSPLVNISYNGWYRYPPEWEAAGLDTQAFGNVGGASTFWTGPTTVPSPFRGKFDGSYLTFDNGLVEDGTPHHFEQSIPVDFRFENLRFCNGQHYRLVGLEFDVRQTWPSLDTGEPADLSAFHAEMREDNLWPWLPELQITVNRCAEGGGIPIELPSPILVPGGDMAGIRRKRDRVVG